MRTKRALISFLALVVLITAAPAIASGAEVDDIDGPEDFTQLAGDGFAFGVPGNPVDGYTSLAGTPDNTYNWTGLHFDPDGPGGDPGMLLMGTLQNTFDFNQSFESRLAQIWRYDIPAVTGTAGDPAVLQGDWEMVWESDLIDFAGLVSAPECVGMRGSIQTNIDGVERAVFSCTGAQGKLIATTDGETFTDATTAGFPVAGAYIGFRDIVAVDWNDDGTDDALMISPVGVLEENGVIRTDFSPDDVMLVNTSPFAGYSRWRTAAEAGFGNDDNFVNFLTKAFDSNGDGNNDAVGVVASNRVSGAEMYVTTDTCPTGFFQELLGVACSMDWELVFDEGVGKPLVNVADNDEPPDIRNPNAYGSDLTQVGETVYVTLGETAFQGNEQAADEAEVIAIYPPGSADCPTGADCGDWVVEMLMGDPREGTAAALESSILNFHCTEVTNNVGDWCVPTSYMTASFGEVGDPDDADLDWSDLDEGRPFYVWRAASDGTHAYFSTAGSSVSGTGGFEVWRLDPAIGATTAADPPGGTLTNLFRELGDGNLGGRTMFYADPLGLVIGTATFEAGTDIYVGGCYDGPPVADPGSPQVFFDRSGNDVVTYVPDDDDDDPDYDGYDLEGWFRSPSGWIRVDINELGLDGSGSRGAPCDDLVSLAWYAGTGCTGSPLASWTSVDDDGFGIYDPGSYATDGDGSADGIRVHEFSLEATADAGGTSCTNHSVTASSNLPPEVTVTDVTAVAPDVVDCNSNLSDCIVVDVNEDDVALIEVTASCVDPDGDALTSCEWTSDYTHSDVTPTPVLFEGSPTYEQTPAGETVTVAFDATSFSLEQCEGVTGSINQCLFNTDIDLVGTDPNGFSGDDDVEIYLVPPRIDVQIETDGGGSDQCDEDYPGVVDPDSDVCIITQDTPFVGVPVEVWVQVENDGSVPADVTVTLDPGGNGTVVYLDDPAPFPYELPPFGVETFMKFEWTPGSVGVTTLTAEITSASLPADDDPDDNVRSRDYEVVAAPTIDLAVTAVTPDGTTPEDTAETVGVTITNNGTDTASEYDVALYVDSSASGGSCSGVPLETKDETDGGPIVSDGTVEIDFDWTPTEPGGVDLCAQVTITDDGVPANDALDAEVDVLAAVDLSVTDVAPDEPVVSGAAQTVTVTVTNNGTDPAAADGYSVTLTDGTGSGGTCSGSTIEAVTSPDVRLGAISATGGTVEIDIGWTPGPAGPATLCAEVAIGGDADEDNDAADTAVTVTPAPAADDLSVTDIATDGDVEEDVTETVTVTVTNLGTDAATAYSVELFAGSSVSGDSCSGGSSLGVMDQTDGGTIASAGSADLDFSWTPTDPGDVDLCAQVTLTGDEDTSNDAMDTTVNVDPAIAEIHLSGLTGTFGGGVFVRTASATATVSGDGGTVAGATVTFSFTRGILGTATTSCVTNGSGSCTATGTVWFSASSTWTVTDISAPDSVYVPGDNTATNPLTID